VGDGLAVDRGHGGRGGRDVRDLVDAVGLSAGLEVCCEI
jgi:hypothetical protein